MIGAMTGGEGLSSAASSYFASQAQGVNGLSSLSSLTGGEGGGSQSSTAISGPGQLLSNLQQLQTSDPTTFQQVVTQIASQLQSASQQAQGPQSNVLSNLASKFQNIANGGSLGQLAPKQHHHHSHALQAYSQNSQDSSQGLAALIQSSGSQSSGSQSSTNQSSNGQTSSATSLQGLFTTISNEVSAALAGNWTQASAV
jgi:hypothetical protein